MSHQKHSGSTLHPVHTGTSKLKSEVTRYPSCRSALGLGRRCFVLAVDECQVSALWASAKVDGSEHRDFHMIPPLSRLLCFFPRLTMFQSYFSPILISSEVVGVTEKHSVSTLLTSSTMQHLRIPKINSFSQDLSVVMFSAYQDILQSRVHSLSDSFLLTFSLVSVSSQN